MVQAEGALRRRRVRPRHATSAAAAPRTSVAWWLPVMNLFIPGAPRFLRSSGTGWRWIFLVIPFLFWAVAIYAGLRVLQNRNWAVTLVVHPLQSGLLLGYLVALAIWYLVTYLDLFGVLRFPRLRSVLKPGLAALIAVLLVFSVGSSGYAAYLVNVSRNTISTIFHGRVPDASGPDKQPVVPALDPVDGRYNILLLGGDAGSDRVGRRPDSILAISVDATTGQVAAISIPRNFENVQFPADSPMHQALPEGYNCANDQCIIDFLYGAVDDPDKPYMKLYPNSEDPGAQAMMDAASGILGIKMQAYLLVDMDNFSKLVDALGGITVNSGGWVPISGANIMGTDQHLPPEGWIPPGKVKLNGNQALWFSRSRQWTTDYARNARQQCMIQSMVQQLNPVTVLTKFGQLADAGSKVFESNLSTEEFATFVDLGVKSRSQPTLRLTIGPPDFPADFPPNPDYAQIHAKVQNLLHPPASASPPASGTAPANDGGTQAPAPARSDGGGGTRQPPQQDNGANMTQEAMQALAVRASQGDGAAESQLITLLASNSNCQPVS